MRDNIASLQRENDPSIEALMRRYQQPLYRFCMHLCRSQAEANDLFQDVWLRVMKHAGEMDGMRSEESWLFTIAINLYRDRYRKAKRWLLRIKPYWDADSQKIEMERAVDDSMQPERHMLKLQEKELVRKALGQLKDEHRIAIVLFYMQECSYREMADILGIAEGTVKSRLHAAKLALKKQMEVLDDGR
ncbi:RNA polymerase sigma factor [Paenibacillus marinisediminis]